MASNNIIVYRQYLDKNFNLIEKPEDNKTYVVKVTRAQVQGKDKFKELKSVYTIISGDKSVEFGDKHLKLMKKKSSFLDADIILEKSLAKKSPDVKVTLIPEKLNKLVSTFFTLAVIACVAFIATILLTTTDKNFNKNIVDLSTTKDVKIGDYVHLDSEVWDAYGIEVTSVRKTYGIETSRSKKDGNTYLLVSRKLTQNDYELGGEIETFVFKFAPNSTYDVAFNALGEDEYYLDNLQGAVKSIKDIEKLDQDEQVMDYFRTSITENFDVENLKMNSPIYLIDSKVTQANIEQTVAINAGVLTIAIIFFVCAIVFSIKRNNYIKKTVDDIYSSGPIIK